MPFLFQFNYKIKKFFFIVYLVNEIIFCSFLVLFGVKQLNHQYILPKLYIKILKIKKFYLEKK